MATAFVRSRWGSRRGMSGYKGFRDRAAHDRAHELLLLPDWLPEASHGGTRHVLRRALRLCLSSRGYCDYESARQPKPGKADHMDSTCEDAGRLARAVGDRAKALGVSVAVAESLTGGQVCATLAGVPDAAGWFAGGVVAYRDEVKHGLLAVPPVPVVSRRAALAMASSVARTHDAQYAVALTGVGGPDAQDGIPAGTVLVAVHTPDREAVEELHLPGAPDEVLRAATTHALSLLRDALA
jgi:nicotinamide-nucleotide amidase